MTFIFKVFLGMGSYHFFVSLLCIAYINIVTYYYNHWEEHINFLLHFVTSWYWGHCSSIVYLFALYSSNWEKCFSYSHNLHWSQFCFICATRIFTKNHINHEFQGNVSFPAFWNEVVLKINWTSPIKMMLSGEFCSNQRPHNWNHVNWRCRSFFLSFGTASKVPKLTHYGVV